MAEHLPAPSPSSPPLDIDSSKMLASDVAPPKLTSDAPGFLKEKHIKYWLRCFTTPLPYQYQANDASLLSLTFFTLSALDLLGALETHTNPSERQGYVEAIYACQHPEGGFRGFRGTALSAEKRNEANKVWDPANLPACYFALGSLLVLGDPLERVNKAGCLTLLRRLQRPDGSFGEYLGHDDASVMGGMDSRYGYCAMAVRWILRASSEQTNGRSVHGVPDVDIELLVECIRRSETFDGGLSEEPGHEAHAGFTYCALAALSFLGRLPRDLVDGQKNGLRNPAGVVEWLLGRLTTDIIEDVDGKNRDEDSESEEQNRDLLSADGSVQSPEAESRPSFEKVRSLPLGQDHAPSTSSTLPLSVTPSRKILAPIIPIQLCPNYAVGFSGRANKPADTCYAFWAGASLDLISSSETCALEDYLDTESLRRYLLSHTQHPVAGGFGKFPGDPPDVYHSYMGLAALSVLNQDQDQDDSAKDEKRPSIKRLDPALCMSTRARQWCEALDWRRALP